MAHDTLAGLLAKLTPENLQHVHDVILECSIAASTGGSYKQRLAELRKETKGAKKKVFAALYRAKPDQLQRIADKFVEAF